MLKYFKFEYKLKRIIEDFFKLQGINAEVFCTGDKERFDIDIFRNKDVNMKTIESIIPKLEKFIGRYGIVTNKTDNCITFSVDMNNKIEVWKDNYKYIPLSCYEILLGYNENNDPIAADMLKKPHAIISGLSGQGKSSLIRQILTNLRGVDIILLNSFYSEDFEGMNIRHIEGEKEVVECLTNIYKGERFKRPLYLVIEELSTLRSNKQIDLIYNLLCTARHKNVYIIGCCQEPLKTEYKYKSLFNTRISFSSIDGYKAALGEEYNGILQEREFVCTSKNGIVKGKTYTLTM